MRTAAPSAHHPALQFIEMIPQNRQLDKTIEADYTFEALRDFAGYPLDLGAWYNQQKTLEVLPC